MDEFSTEEKDKKDGEAQQSVNSYLKDNYFEWRAKYH